MEHSHNPSRIQRSLDGPHHRQRLLPDLQQQTVLLSPPDRVLSGTSPLHIQRAPHHILDTLLDLGLFAIRWIINDALVEIAVANMAQDRRKQAEIIHLLLGDFNDISESAEWDSDVGTPYSHTKSC